MPVWHNFLIDFQILRADLALVGPARNGTIVFIAKKIADKIGADTLIEDKWRNNAKYRI